MSRKLDFVREYDEMGEAVSLIIVVVQLPSGALEVIQNNSHLEEKYMYYLETYNQDMVMYKNPDIRILKWIMI